MCGIIAILGIDCAQLLYHGLKKLQNRGYDSAGICTFNSNNDFNITKYASTETEFALDLLARDIHLHQNSINGIGHTRWATHGAKTDINSHPHRSGADGGSITLVHNGILENYRELKQWLKDLNTPMAESQYISETDTEVIVNLIEYHYLNIIMKSSKNLTTIEKINAMEEAVQCATGQMHGTWGLAIQCIDIPGAIFCTRQGSPILISVTERCATIASEQSGFGINTSDTYFALSNHDICTLYIDEDDDKKIKIKMSDNSNPPKARNRLLSDVADTPDPYTHWMLREICEQPDSIARTISLGGRVRGDMVYLGGLKDRYNDLKRVRHLVLLGCGTSLHAAQIGVQYFRDLGGFDTVYCIDGAEFNASDLPAANKNMNVACILLSQSGETRDLHRCIQIGREYNVILIGVVNVVDSLIARECHCGCYLNAGREVSVASTKSFTSQVVMLSMIAIWFSQLHDINLLKRRKYLHDLRTLSLQMKQIIENIINCNKDLPIQWFDENNSCFLLGRGKGESIAREGALKIKEVTYVHAEGYSSGSLKHGPFALLTPKYPVILFAPFEDRKSLNVYEEIYSRKANVWVITDNERNEQIQNQSQFNDSLVLTIPFNETYREILQILPVQLLAYYLACYKNNDPDRPRNLAKVVTVE